MRFAREIGLYFGLVDESDEERDERLRAEEEAAAEPIGRWLRIKIVTALVMTGGYAGLLSWFGSESFVEALPRAAVFAVVLTAAMGALERSERKNARRRSP